jgi:hypothetical protein
MRVDIRPQWKKLTNWYWDSAGGHAGVGMSIWELLQHDYGAFKVFNINNVREDRGMWVEFPDEISYTAFLLRWS